MVSSDRHVKTQTVQVLAIKIASPALDGSGDAGMAVHV